MRPFVLLTLLALILTGCRTEKNYVTYNTGPTDWQPPVVGWHTALDADVRGTVGLDVTVRDSSTISRVTLFVDGQERQTLTASPWRFEVITDSLPDGVHWCEARAWDAYSNLGLSPVLRVNVMNGAAQGPRLIWVPDDYALIQSAINAAADFDTIRVRRGMYREILNTFGKGIWLESETGPMVTRINGIGSNSVITISPSDIVGTVRGFWLEGAERLVRYELGGQSNFFNNVFLDDTAMALFYTSYSGGQVWNNLFAGGSVSVEIGYHWGGFYNNMIIDVQNTAFWNAAIATNPLEYGYNLFWNNGQNYGYFEPGIGDIIADPGIDLTNGRLLEDSPAIDQGDPSINDVDGTRSDIGPFGGLWAYHN